MSRIDDVSTAQTAASRDGAASRWLKWVAEGLLICFALTTLAVSESLPQILANQNHAPAGIFRDGVLSINLEIARGEWREVIGGLVQSQGQTVPDVCRSDDLCFEADARRTSALVTEWSQ